MAAPPPQRIGKYLIDSVLGRGGMGEVYKAHDETLGRFVALKIMRGPSLDDEQARERFVREAQAAGGLRHPNIVTVYDLGEVDGQLFIAMEHIKGDDLEQIIKQRRPLMIDDRLSIMIQASEGVSYAHKNQIVHRDLKPSNIRIDEEGVVKIMDFGIAKLESSNMTASGTVMGTPFYMSPEQVRGLRVDFRSDVFSLGCILYEVFAYQKAFSGEMAAVFYKIAHEAPPPLADFVNVPSGPLQQIIDLCLEKDKNRRLQTAAELADMLRDVQRGYREMNSATVIGLRAETGTPSPEHKIASPPTAVSSVSRSRPGTFSDGTAAPGTVAAWTLQPSEAPPAVPGTVAPGTRYDPTQMPHAQQPPVAQAPAQKAGGGALKIILLLFAVFFFMAAGGVGVYFFAFRDKPPADSGEYQKKVDDAKALYNAKKYDEASAIYEALLLEKPGDANVHFLNGAAKQKLGKTQEALVEYQRAVELDQKMERAWQQIGFILMERMDYANAENAFRQAIELNPRSGASWEGLAQTYRAMPNEQKSEDAYRKLLELEPQNIAAHYNLGLIQAGKKDDAGAAKAFQRVLELNPNHAEAHNNLGNIYLRSGDVDRAIQENEAAIELKPNLAAAHYNLSVAYEQKGDKTSAAEHLQKYLEITGDDDQKLKARLEALRS